MNAQDRKKEIEQKKKQQKKKEERACQEKRVLLIKNIPPSLDIELLKKQINAIHPAENYTILNDFLQKKLKRAFVTFSCPEDAADVVTFLKQKQFTRLGIFVALASPSKKSVENVKGNNSVIDQIVRVGSSSPIRCRLLMRRIHIILGLIWGCWSMLFVEIKGWYSLFYGCIPIPVIG